jgi:hypothetical protein
VLAFVDQEARAQRDALLAAHTPGGAEWVKQNDTWRAQTLADPALGATPEERDAAIAKGTQVIRRFAEADPDGGGTLMQFLDDSGLQHHPGVVRFFAWLGKSAGEGTMIHATPESGKRDPKDVMYPGQSGPYTGPIKPQK